MWYIKFGSEFGTSVMDTPITVVASSFDDAYNYAKEQLLTYAERHHDSNYDMIISIKRVSDKFDVI